MKRALLGAALTLAIRPALSYRAEAQSPSTKQTEASARQAALNTFADHLGYRFAIVDNKPTCPAKIKKCALSTITLKIPRTIPHDLPTADMALYFSYVGTLIEVESDRFDGALINGDLHRLTLKPGKSIQPGETIVIKLWGTSGFLSRIFGMPNAFLAAGDLKARVIAATRPTTDPATGLEALTFVDAMTDEAKLAGIGADDATRWLTPERAFALQQTRAAPAATGIVILPKPAHARLLPGADVDLRHGVAISVTGASRDAIAPALNGLGAIGVSLSGKVPLSISVEPASSLPQEGYSLRADRRGIVVKARDVAGASYALRSLAQQALFNKRILRPLEVTDAPTYPFRGLHIDIARNFHGRDEILKIVEAMASYKLNRLHLHLADDEGWRIAIPGLPELTEIGSRRCFDPAEARCLMPQLGSGPDGTSAVNGYLTTSDYIQIVRAAAARNIVVIPSIDMPGHSRAAIKSMEVRYNRLRATGDIAGAEKFRLVEPGDKTQYRSIQNYNDNTLNVCIPATYRFFDAVVDALSALHREAGQPLQTFHIGADETAGAWTESPACADQLAKANGDGSALGAGFIERIAADLAARGIATAGWSDGLGHTDPARMPGTTQTNIWGPLHRRAITEAHEQINRGWNVVLSIPDLGYFDMPYAPHPDEGGYTWATRGVDTHQVYAFMPDNLPANAALIADTDGGHKTIVDQPQRRANARIIGVQGQLWSETVRANSQVEYLLFPRLLALAERGWSPAPWTPPYQPGANYAWQDPRVDRGELDAGWQDFAGRLAAQFPLLDRLHIAYRLEPPGARIENGVLSANATFPGTHIEYRARGGKWYHYSQPIAVSGRVQLRAVTADGRRASRSVTVPTDVR